MYILLNGEQVESNEAGISPLASGFQYGYGLFETIKVYQGRILLLPQHLERLENGCAQLGLSWNMDPEELTTHCLNLIQANGLSDGSLKILYAKNQDTCDLLISTRPHVYTPEQYAQGFTLCLASARRDPLSKLSYLKSCNYLENLLAREEAVAKGCNEALFLNDSGAICEGSFTNLFFVRDKILYTPKIECGLLPGILRQELINLAERHGMSLATGEYSLDDLRLADEVFLTNSLMDIMPVSRFEEKEYDLQTNGITRQLQRLLTESIYPVSGSHPG